MADGSPFLMSSPLADTPDPTPDETAGPLARYRARRDAGHLASDAGQERVAGRLDALYHALMQPQPEPRRGWLVRLGFAGANEPARPRGLYLFGPVGRGKSILMDLFFAAAPRPGKRRAHFHAFMLDVHDRLEHERRAGTERPILKVAADLAAEAPLLCFDEFQVEDIADAMILGRLFTVLFEAGVIVVATSNRPPDRLYERGLQRERFLPFVALLKERLDVIELAGGRDYRLARLIDERVYHHPLDIAAHQALERAFAELADGEAPAPATLVVKGRELVVPRAVRNVAWFRFDELCERPLAAADYLEIARRFGAVVIEAIPRLSPHQRNAARRFTILIDTLYEARSLIIASAQVPPEEIYPAGDGSFAFRRTVSRLAEMQSEAYLARRRRG